MKLYPKTYEDLFDPKVSNFAPAKVGSAYGTPEYLAKRFRDFYRESHRQLFYMYVCELWLERQFKYGTERRLKHWGNGHSTDRTFAWFMTQMVGVSTKPISSNFLFTVVTTYFKDLFPDFLKRNPFDEPEYYRYPFEHVSLDFLLFVYQMDNRMEILWYADKHKMTYREFGNWVANWIHCYNDDIGKEQYTIGHNSHFGWPYVKNKNLKGKKLYKWREEKFEFDL